MTEATVASDPAITRFGAMRDLIAVIREGVISAAILLLLGLLLVSPSRLRLMLEQAGIQSVKLPWLEVEATLKENSEQLASAKTELNTARSALRSANEELSTVRTRVDRLASTARMEPAASAELRELSGRLATSSGKLTTSTSRVAQASSRVDGTLERQRVLTRKIEAVQK